MWEAIGLPYDIKLLNPTVSAFLYLLDNDTSWVVLISAGVGTRVLWKVRLQ